MGACGGSKSKPENPYKASQQPSNQPSQQQSPPPQQNPSQNNMGGIQFQNVGEVQIDEKIQKGNNQQVSIGILQSTYPGGDGLSSQGLVSMQNAINLKPKNFENAQNGADAQFESNSQPQGNVWAGKSQ